jgi:exosortase
LNDTTVHAKADDRQSASAATLHAWRGWSVARVLGALALTALAIGVWLDPWLDVHWIAMRDREATHIFLVPFVVGWIAWARREAIARATPRSTFLGPGVILLGWAISFFGYQTQIQALWHGGAVMMALGAFLSVMGWRVLWAAAPAVVALGFLVPVPVTLRQQIALPLQNATASAAHVLCQTFGLAVEQSGNVLVYNGTRVAVAEACNGMRMVFALLMVAYTFAFVFPLRPAVKALVLITSPLLAVLCNVIRLVPTVWVYGHYPDSLAPLFHDLNGWVMLLVAFVLLEGAVRLLQWLQIPVYQPQRAAYG